MDSRKYGVISAHCARQQIVIVFCGCLQRVVQVGACTQIDRM